MTELNEILKQVEEQIKQSEKTLKVCSEWKIRSCVCEDTIILKMPEAYGKIKRGKPQVTGRKYTGTNVWGDKCYRAQYTTASFAKVVKDAVKNLAVSGVMLKAKITKTRENPYGDTILDNSEAVLTLRKS